VAEFEITPAIEWLESDKNPDYSDVIRCPRFFLELLDDETAEKISLLHVVPDGSSIVNDWELLYPWNRPDDQISA
jgi:hypothetical protein